MVYPLGAGDDYSIFQTIHDFIFLGMEFKNISYPSCLHDK